MTAESSEIDFTSVGQRSEPCRSASFLVSWFQGAAAPVAIDVIVSAGGSSDVAYQASNHAGFWRTLLLVLFYKISTCTYPYFDDTDNLRDYLFQMSE